VKTVLWQSLINSFLGEFDLEGMVGYKWRMVWHKLTFGEEKCGATL
jgi:hypothetical protein